MERNQITSGARNGAQTWQWVCAAALLLTCLLTVDPAQAQAPSGSQAEEGRGRGGFAGGKIVHGTISAVNGDHLSVKAEDGHTYEIATTSNTRVMRQRQSVKLTDLRPGDGVGAAGVLEASTHTLHAVALFVVSAEDIRKAQENLGKTYITGRVTAIDDLRLTIKRPDGVSQVIEVDEGTSFRRGGHGSGSGAFAESEGGSLPAQRSAGDGVGPPAAQQGESITLADIKVGDNIFASGALHGGVFHPTELRVGNPRRRRGDAPGGASLASPAPNSDE